MLIVGGRFNRKPTHCPTFTRITALPASYHGNIYYLKYLMRTFKQLRWVWNAELVIVG